MSANVSVIIPTFDRGYVLREAVDSALDQLYREVEVIVVDDGSSDGTDELMATAYGGDARVRYLYQPNAGLASARNTGLDLATGDYVAFLDSDDSWKPWHLGLLLACLDRLPQAGMIWANMDTVDASGDTVSALSLTEFLSAYRYFSLDDLFSSSFPLSEIGVDLPPESTDRRLYVGDIFSQMVMGNLVPSSSVLIRRERLEQVGRLNERMRHVEDNEFFLRVCRAGPVAFADIAGTRIPGCDVRQFEWPRRARDGPGVSAVARDDPRSRRRPDHPRARDDRRGSGARAPMGRRTGTPGRLAPHRARAWRMPSGSAHGDHGSSCCSCSRSCPTPCSRRWFEGADASRVGSTARPEALHDPCQHANSGLGTGPSGTRRILEVRGWLVRGRLVPDG